MNPPAPPGSMSSTDSPARWLLVLCGTQASTVLVFLNFAGALPLVQVDLQLSNAEAGAVQAAGQLGYIAAVLVLSSLTDFIGAKRVIAGGALWAGLSNLAMAWIAQDALGAVLLRASVGLGMAGIYMPGVRLLSELVPADRRGRALGIFVASFTVGSAIAIAAGGSLAARLGWRTAFALLSIGPILGALLAWSSLPASPARRVFSDQSTDGAWLMRNRPLLMIAGIYAAHAWEVLGLRAWLTAYLTDTLVRNGIQLGLATQRGATVAGAATLLGAVSTASVAALSDRAGRFRTTIIVSGCSVVAIVGLGQVGGLSWGLVVLSALLAAALANADSAVISTSFTEAVPARYLGRALAIYSFAGFAAGGIAPLVVGTVLDSFSNLTGPWGPWGWAFAVLSLGSLFALGLATRLYRESR